MAFRKHGTSEDQRVLADENDTQGVRKQSNQSQSREEILRELARENEGDE